MKNETTCHQPNASQKSHNLTKAKFYENNGEYYLAWTEAIKSINQHPFHPEAYIQMASAAFSAKDPKAALSAAERALDLTPKWPTAIKLVKTLRQYILNNSPDSFVTS